MTKDKAMTTPTPTARDAAYWRDRLERYRNDGSCEREILAALAPQGEGGDVEEPKPPFRFDRYVDGRLMAEGVRINRAETLTEATAKAVTLCRRDRQVVLVYRPDRDEAGLQSRSSQSVRDRDEFIRRVIESVCELPDRTSPEDEPEMMLVTGEELSGILENHWEQLEFAPPHPVNAEGAKTVSLVPTREMIDAGAQRLVRWEGDCTWPDSWDKLEVSAARNEAERVWRSMWLEAVEPFPGHDEEIK